MSTPQEIIVLLYKPDKIFVMNTDNNSGLKILLKKYFNRECTEAEKQQLFQSLLVIDNEKTITKILKSHLFEYAKTQDEGKEPDFEKMYNNIISEISKISVRESKKLKLKRKQKFKRLYFQISKIAAIAIISFVLGSVLSNLYETKSDKHIAQNDFYEIIAPYGARSEINLPDGTNVLLNAGSKIKYSNTYNRNNRDIELEGEAYFKVAHNEEIPLIVKVKDIGIRALGTEFNVKAYNDDKYIETTLIKGKVEITKTGTDNKAHKIVDLLPKEKALFVDKDNKFLIKKIQKDKKKKFKKTRYKSDKLLVSKKIDTKPIIAWIQKRMIIEAEDMESLSVKLARKFDVSFKFSTNDIKKYRVSGVLEDETLEQVLNVIKLATPIEYEVKGKLVTLSVNRKLQNEFNKYTKKKTK